MLIGEALQSFEAELSARALRAKEEKTQSTWRQQKAIDACNALGEKKYGLYLRLYKMYDVARLDACVDWAMKCDNPARAFTRAWRKFVHPQPSHYTTPLPIEPNKGVVEPY